MRKATVVVGALVGLAVAAIAYKYVASDEYERACGFPNPLRTDYSPEIQRQVQIKDDGSEILADFRGLKNWKTACVTLMYEDTITLPPPRVSRNDKPYFSHQVGKWQCRRNPPGTIAILLISADGGGLARQVRLPMNLASKIENDYSLPIPPGFSQCADVQKAVARCAWISTKSERRCMLLFPNQDS